MSILQRARSSLVLKITVPTVVMVLGASLAASQLLTGLFARIHERHAAERAHHVAGLVEQEFARAMEERHGDVAAELRTLCRASDKSVAVTDRSGRVRFACDDTLLGTTLPVVRAGPAQVWHGQERWARHQRPLHGDASCTRCHGATRPVGYLAVDSPLVEGEEEVREMQRLNLAADTVLAVAVSVLLILVQLVLVYRPLRQLTATVESIRAGDLSARAAVAGGDEIWRLAESLNAMAASIERAKVELDRTYRTELAQAEKLAALGQLTSSIAHEIKNPLAGIIGALRIVEEETPAGEANKQILGKIRHQMERLSLTAVSLLEFARPLKPSVRAATVVEILDHTLFFVERQAAEQRVEIRRRYASELPAVRVDPDLMKQVFLNLVLNGIQAMPRGGTLGVEARSDGAAVEIAVSDQGIGIPQEHLDHIFSPFFTTKTQGTGLGLYVARQIVETQRGEIKVATQLGHGTTFTVRLPAGRSQEEPHGAD
ncbi:MAG TPA: ATP-binding protein [Polyangia bacterium]